MKYAIVEFENSMYGVRITDTLGVDTFLDLIDDSYQWRMASTMFHTNCMTASLSHCREAVKKRMPLTYKVLEALA